MLAGGLTGLLASCAGPQQDSAAAAVNGQASASNAATLFYASAPDCPYCRIWEQHYRAGFEASALRRRLRFVQLRVPTVRFGSLYEPAWPEPARWVRRALIQGGVTGAMPLFVLVRGGDVLDADQGLYDGEAYGWRGSFTASIWRAA